MFEATISTTNPLPPEIWRAILREATHTPGLLDPTWDHSPSEMIWDGWFLEGVEKSANINLYTKPSIVQVSRQWKAMGVEFLYEAFDLPLDLRGCSRVAGLINALRRDKLP